MNNLVKKWGEEADSFQQQAEEQKNRGFPDAEWIATAETLNQCAAELKAENKGYLTVLVNCERLINKFTMEGTKHAVLEVFGEVEAILDDYESTFGVDLKRYWTDGHTPPVEELKGAKPVIVYFKNDEERNEFIEAVQKTKPRMKARKL